MTGRTHARIGAILVRASSTRKHCISLYNQTKSVFSMHKQDAYDLLVPPG
jgi:hypothetical protein